jgi:hypothetical protein
VLSQGAVDEIALRNLNAVEVLLKMQMLHYDFKYHHLEMETDIRVIVISEGRSMFTKVVECVVPLEEDGLADKKVTSVLCLLML